MDRRRTDPPVRVMANINRINAGARHSPAREGDVRTCAR
jgi:hypothetical protein